MGFLILNARGRRRRLPQRSRPRLHLLGIRGRRRLDDGNFCSIIPKGVRVRAATRKKRVLQVTHTAAASLSCGLHRPSACLRVKMEMAELLSVAEAEELPEGRVYFASLRGEMTTVQNWLAQGGDPNQGLTRGILSPHDVDHIAHDAGTTLLMAAASMGQLDVVRLLRGPTPADAPIATTAGASGGRPRPGLLEGHGILSAGRLAATLDKTNHKKITAPRTTRPAPAPRPPTDCRRRCRRS